MAQDRESIMSKCPEEFKGSLKEFIDEIEGRVLDAKGLMEITGLRSISQIADAFVKLEDLLNDLY